MADEYELKQVSVRLCLKEAEPLYSSEPITNSEKAVEVMAKAMAELDREHFYILLLDSQKRTIAPASLSPTAFNLIAVGDLNQTMVPIQNIFKAAIMTNAAALIGLHNHPSGSLTPSQADLSVTKRMVEAGRLIGIPVTDHIIVAGGSGLHTSIRNTNPELFSFVAEQSPRFIADESPRFVGEQSPRLVTEQSQKFITDWNFKKRVSVKNEITEKKKMVEKKAMIVSKSKEPRSLEQTL